MSDAKSATAVMQKNPNGSNDGSKGTVSHFRGALLSLFLTRTGGGGGTSPAVERRHRRTALRMALGLTNPPHHTR